MPVLEDLESEARTAAVVRASQVDGAQLLDSSLALTNSVYGTLYTMLWPPALRATAGPRSEISTATRIDPLPLTLGAGSFRRRHDHTRARDIRRRALRARPHRDPTATLRRQRRSRARRQRSLRRQSDRRAHGRTRHSQATATRDKSPTLNSTKGWRCSPRPPTRCTDNRLRTTL